MDANLQQRRHGLEDKIPDIRKSLSMAEFLLERRVRSLGRFRIIRHLLTLDRVMRQEGKSKSASDDDDLEDEDETADVKPIRTTFELNDTLYAEAEIEDTDTVHIWLGVRWIAPHITLMHSADLIA
jgi:hypothetical protein